MSIYTKTGDRGQTGLFDGTRVDKEDLRVSAYGDVDELNSQLGLLRSTEISTETDEELDRVQCDLFEIGGDLAMPGSTKSWTACQSSRASSCPVDAESPRSPMWRARSAVEPSDRAGEHAASIPAPTKSSSI